jgi:putative ABC transport system permease protein
MAEKFWPGKSAVGRAIRLGDDKHAAKIIGVTADTKYATLDEAIQPFMYYPLAQNYQAGEMLIARTKGDPKLWKEPLARMIRGLGVKVPLPPVTLENWINLTLFVPIFVLGCVAGLSALGIFLATIGLYGAISYSVGERRKELGIRIALGARPGQVMSMVFRETLWVSGAGVAAGLAFGVAATVIFRSQLYGIERIEWRVLAPVTIGMVGLSLTTAFLAARRWTRMNPMDAVRHT